MKLVIAEKPMLARDIARAMCGKQVSETARLPISGNGYTVIGCRGHLMELVEPDDIDPKWARWNIDDLPIEIPDWPKEPAVVRNRSPRPVTVDGKTYAPGAVIDDSKKKLVEAIAALLPDADCVINAGDPDDEGQLIVDELLDYLGYDGKVLRVYVNDNIEKNIVRAFENLVPNEDCRGAGRAAYARQMADKCFGVNETRLATVRLGALFTVGRVQTPTLGLVVSRDEAIENHVTRTFYELTATGRCPDAEGSPVFKFKPGKELLAGEKHLFERGTLDALKVRLDGADAPFETRVAEKRENPPLPYNLTVLLSDMSARFGFSASKTQQTTQALRDKYKAITYNRSDSQYLKEEHFAQAPAVLAQAMRNVGADWELDFSIRSSAFNDKNVTAHHGIIPQEADAPVSEMTEDEAKVYTAIVERYAMQFMPPAVYDVSTSSFEVEGGIMEASARRLKSAGWEGVFKAPAQEGKDKPDPGVWTDAGGHTLSGIECSVTEGKTSPPKPYTEGTLIADMASIAKYVSDPGIREILEAKDADKKGEHGGIGTTATRSGILENLKSRGYLEEVKKGKTVQIRSTAKARAFYRLLPPEIAGADVTARWWLIQQDVEAGKADVNAVQRSVVEVFKGHLAAAYVGHSLRPDRKTVGKCPLCGQDVLALTSKATGKPFYVCSSNKSEKQEDGTYRQLEGCGFKLFGFKGKTFSEEQASSLLSGKAVPLKGCKSKEGRPFDCRVALARDGGIDVLFDHKDAKGGAKGAGRRRK